MTLRRLTSTSAHTDVALTGFFASYAPDQVGQGGIVQGDASVWILNDEIASASWPGPPAAGDQMILPTGQGTNTRLWIVKGSTPVWEGPNCIGHNLFIRGG